MARSRNIKPGLFSNDELAECDIYARFLFTGLWTIADKAGRLEDRPKKIKVQILPYDSVDCDDLLNQLVKYGFIMRYSIDNKAYIQIVNWVKHQNPHKNENESEIPAPNFLTKKGQINGNRRHSKKNNSTENIGTHPADSLNLIPDSLNLINSEGDITDNPKGYAFYGQIIKLSHGDFDKWRSLYPTIDLHHELNRLDLEFQHQKPKNWFITASQKINYQYKQCYKTTKINNFSNSSSKPNGFKVVNG